MPRTRALLVAALVLAPALASGDPPDPAAAAQVERLHDSMVGLMREAGSLGYQGRADRIAPVVDAVYDIPFMAEKSVGRHWGELSPVEKAQLVERFRGLTVANYANRLDAWSGQHFRTVGSESGVQGTLLVKTLLVRSADESVQLDYRLHRSAGAWRIIDVYMNGTVSELALRRSEYSAVLKREGFASLMKAIDDKIAALRSS